MKATRINYDPHHMIYKRRHQHKKKAFEHQEIEGLAGRANLMEYHLDAENSESLQENPFSRVKSTSMIIQTPSKVEIIGKRSFSEVVEVEDEDSEAYKIPKIDLKKEMVEVGSKNMKEKNPRPRFSYSGV